MKALLTSLVMTGSPSSGSASGLNSKAGVPGMKQAPGVGALVADVDHGSAVRAPGGQAPPRCAARRRGLLREPQTAVVERALDVDDEEGGGHAPKLREPVARPLPGRRYAVGFLTFGTSAAGTTGGSVAFGGGFTFGG